MNTIINTDRAPAAVGPYVQAIRAGNTLYSSGHLGMDPRTGALPPDGEAVLPTVRVDDHRVLLRALLSGNPDFARWSMTVHMFDSRADSPEDLQEAPV